MLWVQISIQARCTTLCHKVCQWLVTGRWFSLGPPVSSTNKTDRHDITEILLKVALNTIKQTNKLLCLDCRLFCLGVMFYLCYLYLFKYTGVRHDFHVRWCSCHLKVTWQVWHVEQELLTLLGNLSSPPVLSGVHVAWSLVFCVMFYRSLFVLLSFLLWLLYCFFFFDLRLLITPLVSSNFFTLNTTFCQKFHKSKQHLLIRSIVHIYLEKNIFWGRRGRDDMVVGYTTTYEIDAYHHWCCEFESHSLAGLWFSQVSSTNKSDCHNIAEILLKVALNTMKPTNYNIFHQTNL
jgi:hypothetical protein